MQKIKTTIKTMLLAVIVLVTAQGCIPTMPTGGNPTPTIQEGVVFNIGVSSTGNLTPTATTVNLGGSKTFIIDNDSITFSSRYQTGGMFGGQYQEIKIKLPDGNLDKYQFIINANPDLNYYQNPKLINENLYLSDGLDSTMEWFDINYFSGVNSVVHSGSTISPGSLQIISPLNENRYIALRKRKNNGYLYFWVKVKCEEIADTSSFWPSYKVSVVSAKYQMDSIITGQ